MPSNIISAFRAARKNRETAEEKKRRREQLKERQNADTFQRLGNSITEMLVSLENDPFSHNMITRLLQRGGGGIDLAVLPYNGTVRRRNVSGPIVVTAYSVMLRVERMPGGGYSMRLIPMGHYWRRPDKLNLPDDAFVDRLQKLVANETTFAKALLEVNDRGRPVSLGDWGETVNFNE